MILTDKWRVEYDQNNFILQFFETREKQHKDGTTSTYEYVESFFHPTMKSALLSFANKSLNGSETIDEVIKRIENLEAIIKNLKTA